MLENEPVTSIIFMTAKGYYVQQIVPMLAISIAPDCLVITDGTVRTEFPRADAAELAFASHFIGFDGETLSFGASKP